jgi:hypothetical protein
MNLRTITVAAIALVAIIALALLGTWRLTEAHGPDVNKDGVVRIPDISAVVKAYGQNIPTATAVPTPTAIPLVREYHIVITERESGMSSPPLCANWCDTRVPIDSSKYPPGTTFRLAADVSGYRHVASMVSTCVYLVDFDSSLPESGGTGQPVSGSDACVELAPCPGGTCSDEPRFILGPPFVLPTGQHLYSANGYVAPEVVPTGRIYSVRLIAEVP